MRFADKTVVVTGSTRGIGKEIAFAFAREGACSVIIGRDEFKAETVAREICDLGLAANSFSCDVANWQNVQETVNKILDKKKCIDILVNNAGITRDNLLLRIDENDWNEVIDTNLKGAFHFIKAVTKPMLKAKKGKIISIASIVGITGNAGQSNYAASKAGIIALTKSVAREFASRGITANTIAPGYIETEMTAQLSENVRSEVLKNIPLSRFGTVQDVAGVCLFLASDEAGYITGQTIIVDGGMAI